MRKNIRLNKQEKQDLGESCYVEVSSDFIYVWGGGDCEAAFPIRHWEDVKAHIDNCLKNGSKKHV